MVSGTLSATERNGHGGVAALDGALDPVALRQAALDHIWIHEQPWADVSADDALLIVERGEGSTIWDVNGRAYIDGLSGLWVVNAGHGRTEIAEAMARQASKLAYASSNSFTTGPAIRLADALADLTPGDLDRLFFCSGGSEAVETALKIVKQVQAMRGFPRRYKIIARRGSYHGRTLAAQSLTAGRNEVFFGPFMYGVSHVPHPNRYRSDFGVEGEQAEIMAARYVEQEIENQGPETVAAVIAEPVSSSAGVHVPSPVYWRMLREVCDRHGVLLIVDEVITGFGRTGTMFAIERYGIVPDLMTMAKGLSSGYAPAAAVAVRSSIFEGFKAEGTAGFDHLLTFGGHAVACAAALRNLQVFADEGLVQQAADKGAYLKARLEELRAHPTVGDVRGVGLFCALDLVRSKQTRAKMGKGSPFVKRLSQLLIERGLVTRVYDVMHFSPPLVVTKDEIDRMVTIADDALTIAEREFAAEIEG